MEKQTVIDVTPVEEKVTPHEKPHIPATMHDSMSMEDITTLAEQIVSTKFFPVKKKEEAAGILLMAKDLGIPPAVALNKNIFHFNGAATLSAAMIKSLALKSKLIHWNVKDKWKDIYDSEGNWVDAECNVEFSYVPVWAIDAPDRWNHIERCLWTYKWSEAVNSGQTSKKGPWQEYPKDMMLKQCIIQGIRQLYPLSNMGMYEVSELNPEMDMEMTHEDGMPNFVPKQ